jgi:(1->4)-alpha-D-glucan 1-alpha-D-glucosylmutase
MRLMHVGLALRREHPDLFAKGEYIPLETAGAADHLVAFARTLDDRWVIVVAPRVALALLQGTEAPLVPRESWADTRVIVPESAKHLAFKDLVTGHRFSARTALPAAEILDAWPVALLYARGPQ